MRTLAKKSILGTFSILMLLTLNLQIAHAADLTFESLLTAIVSIFLPTAIGAIGVPLVIYNGYRLMSSQGDPQQVRDAKEGLTAAIVGMIFLFFSMSIIRLILSGFFGQ